MADEASRRPITEAELDALKMLWELGPSPAGRIRVALASHGRDWAYTTTKTILDRLEEKGYVRRDRRETPHIYVPIMSAAGVARDRLGELRKELFDGRDLPLVRALLDGARLSSEAIAELRATLDSLESEGGRQ